MISASLNRCKGIEDQVGDFLKQLAAKLELVMLRLFRCIETAVTKEVFFYFAAPRLSTKARVNKNLAVMCPSYFCRVRVIGFSSQSRVRVILKIFRVESES